MTKLYKIDGTRLIQIESSSLHNEAMLQTWIANEPDIVGLDVLIIGREITTENGGRIDILGIDRDGDLTIIETKRDRTPREVIAQVLDYASWVSSLTTRQVHELASSKLRKPLEDAYKDRFPQSLPEVLNRNHHMVIVASEFDSSSSRIVQYLADVHGVAINAIFFSVFENAGHKLLATAWLMDQEQVIEKSESKQRAPWTGYYYVNAGHDPEVRNWEDMRKYGFVSAGYGRRFSKQLERLSIGSPIYVYQKSRGYIGFGIVTSAPVMAKEFHLVDGKALQDVKLSQEAILHDADNPEDADYLVGIDWKKTVSIDEAETFFGAFANQNVVCKLTHPATLDFLSSAFGTQ